MKPTPEPNQRPRLSWILATVALSLGALFLRNFSLITARGLEGMFPWQQAKLRWLLVVSGAWLILAGGLLLARHVLRRRPRGTVRPPAPPTSRPVALLLGTLILVHIAAHGWLATQRHARFNSTGFDLAIKEQVLWNTAHGRFFASSPEVSNAFADHFQPLMLAFLPFYVLAPFTQTLLWSQTITLALGAIPLYRLARRRLNSPALGLAMAAAYLLSPTIGFIQRFDFHPEVVAIPAFMAAFDALDRDNLAETSLWLIVPLLAKENLGLTVACLGLYAALVRRRVGFGLTWTGVGLAVSILTMFWLIPTLRQAPSDTLSRYGWLGESPTQMVCTLVTRPGFVWSTLAEPNRALYVLQLLAPVGFAALLGLPELLPAVPGLAINLLAQHHCQAEIYCQYAVPIVPFIFLATVTGLQRLRGLVGQGPLHRLFALAVVPLTLVAWAVDNPFTERDELPAAMTHLPNEEAVRRALDVVPPGASVVTTNAYAPHLARREDLYIVGIPAQRDPPPDPDVVFVNLYDQRFILCEAYQAYFNQLDLGQYGVIFRDAGVIVIEKGGGSNEAFRDFLLNWTDCAG